MVKEYMDSIPDSVDVVNENGKHYIHKMDSVFVLSVQELINVLDSSAKFYLEPTPEIMREILNEYIKGQIEVLKEDAGWYIQNAMPEFMKGEFKRKN